MLWLYWMLYQYLSMLLDWGRVVNMEHFFPLSRSSLITAVLGIFRSRSPPPDRKEGGGRDVSDVFRDSVGAR